MTTFKATLKKHWIVISLLLFIVISIQATAWYFRTFAGKIAVESFAPYTESFALYEDIVKRGDLPEIQMANAIAMLDQAEKHKAHHEEIALSVFKYRYSTVTMLLICSVLLAAMLLYITPKGWNTVNDTLKVIFLCFAAHSAYYTGAAIVYGQEETLSENTAQYITYDNIQKSLLSYVMAYQHAKDSIARDTMLVKLNAGIKKTNEGIIAANKIEFNLKEYKATTETLNDLLSPESGE